MKIFCIIFLQISAFQQDINQLIANFLSKENQKNINISISIQKTANDSVVYAYNSQQFFPPASTLKLLTTGACLNTLGPDFAFKTNVFYSGEITDSVLIGNLIIEGKGDPTFASIKNIKENPFDVIAKNLKTKGIKIIKGKVIVLNQGVELPPDSWPWGDVGNYYGAFPGMFNYNENSFSVYFNAGSKIGDEAQIFGVWPQYKKWNIINKVSTGKEGSGDQVNIYSLPFGNDILMKGTVPIKSKRFEVKGAMPNPAQVFELDLKNYLNSNNITIENMDFNASKTFLLTEITSFKLSDLILTTNHQSHNFIADALANYLLKNASISYSNYSEYLKTEHLKSLKNYKNCEFKDGSGLSPNNLISTELLTSYLCLKTKDPNFPLYLSSIPIVGKSGTVARLDPSKATNGNIYAKSGSITSVKNYAGYVNSKNNELFAYAIFVNGINATVQSDLKIFFDNFFRKLIDLNH
jgi:D-alanyl-D-alanine carboxypeptidase/D-alanyl-D-alanine-endopeptidase (penicillin-binding protein 4)